MGKKGVYPGSFDPITNGHIDILDRSTRMFDRVVLAILENPAKDSVFSLADRLRMARESVGGMAGVTVKTFTGLLVDFLVQQKDKLYGLSIAPDRLRQIRKERRPLGNYSSAQQVRFELRECEKLFRRYGIPHVDTTEFSIEEHPGSR